MRNPCCICISNLLRDEGICRGKAGEASLYQSRNTARRTDAALVYGYTRLLTTFLPGSIDAADKRLYDDAVGTSFDRLLWHEVSGKPCPGHSAAGSGSSRAASLAPEQKWKMT